eukprot:8687831-Alexandrium_andersonii.AAC.1
MLPGPRGTPPGTPCHLWAALKRSMPCGHCLYAVGPFHIVHFNPRTAFRSNRVGEPTPLI